MLQRLHENAPANIALYEALRVVKKPQGRPIITLLGVLRKQLRELNINNFHDAINLVQDRDSWRKMITEHVV